MQYIIYQNSVGAWRWALFAEHEPIKKPIAVAPIAYPSEEACRRMLDLVRASASAPIAVDQEEQGVHIDPDRS
jgi:uncharacterized protein YegP (UPF0339 family)